ncbi:MAG TPA: carboxypeptidase-like regulatory domain-containing protein, partial [Candidatus Sphingobacterium stercoripullorum]|nr:carboxypeptidase-like regulatory domain-containing protein [Candidatus Sphingobacterium stercoripullorum]
MKDIFKSFFVPGLILLCSINAFSQRTGIIYGTVENAATQERLIGANIIAEGTSFGTITDFDGNFKLNLPVGTYS